MDATATWTPPEVGQVNGSVGQVGSDWTPPEATEPAAPPTPTPEPDWNNLYAGIDGMDERLDPKQRLAFGALDRTTDNPKETRARAVNQAYLRTQLKGLNPVTIDRNWQAVKDGYAKQVFGIEAKNITDTTLYSTIAQRIQEDEQNFRYGEIKAWTFMDTVGSDVYRTKQALGRFWESINQSLIKLPDPPADLPNHPELGLYNPAIVAGVYKGLKPLYEGTATPLGIASLGAGSGLQIAGETYPVAKVLLATMGGVFSGLMAKSAVEHTGEAAAVLNDPTATVQDKIAAVTGPVAEGAMAILGAVGAAIEVMPKANVEPILAQAKEATPGEVAKLFREQAKEVLPEDAATIEAAAKQLDSLENAPRPQSDLPAQPRETAVEQATTGTWFRGHNEGQPLGQTETFIASTREQAQQFANQQPNGVVSEIVFKREPKIFPGDPIPWQEYQSSWRNSALLKGYDAVRIEEPNGQGTSLAVRNPDILEVKAPKQVVPDKLISIKNEVIDRELAAMGEPPATHGETITFKEALEDAAAKIKEDPHAGARLVERLTENPRPLTGKEDALLLHEQNRLRLERDAAEQELVDAVANGDPDGESTAKFKIAVARDAFNKAAEVATKVGTANAQGLALRRMMMREDYSLAAMERRRVVANEGRPLTAAQEREVRDLSQKVADTQKAFDDYRAAQEAGEPLPPKRPPSRSKVATYLAEQAKAARERVQKRMGQGRVSAGIDPADIADYTIIGADYIARGVTKFATWSAEMVREFGDAVKPHLPEIFARSTEARSDAARLGAFKTRTVKSTKELQRKLDTGDLSKPEPRKPIPLDEEAIRLKAEHEQVKKLVAMAELRDQMNNRTASQKVQSAFAKWVRIGALSWPTVFAKLSGAAIIRTFTTPVEQAVGFGISKLLPELAAKAPREGVPELGGALRAEAKAITEGLTTGIMEAGQMLRNKDTKLQSLFEKTHLPPTLVDYLGKLHGAMKQPTKINEYARSLELRVQHALRNGIDPTDPIQQMRLMHEAYMDSNRAIFMQDNAVVDAYKSGLAALRRKNKATGESSAAMEWLATGIESELPIVKVPTNVIAEASQILTGWLTGPAKAAFAYAKGIEKLHPAEADAIMRLMKKGSIGLALTALGFFKATEVGGFYQPGEKRSEKDVKPGDVRVGDAEIPHQLTHNPYMTAVQFGATMRRAADSRFKKSDTEPRGLASGLLAASLGLIDETPFMREMVTMGKLSDPRQAGGLLEQTIASKLVPGTVQWLAGQMDKKQPFDFTESPTPRKPDGLIENLKKDIPGLRQEVPKKKKTASINLTRGADGRLASVTTEGGDSSQSFDIERDPATGRITRLVPKAAA